MPAGFFRIVFRVLLSVERQVREWDSEGFGEIFGGVVEVKFFEGLPEVEQISLNSAGGIETAKDLTFQICRELPSARCVGFMDGTRATVLVALNREKGTWYFSGR